MVLREVVSAVFYDAYKILFNLHHYTIFKAEAHYMAHELDVLSCLCLFFFNRIDV